MSKSLRVQTDVSLAPYTTFKIGGKARYFIDTKTEQDVIDAINFAGQNNLKVFVLGGGSNTLISDDGFDGVVLKIGSRGISVSKEIGERVLVTARAGEDWDEFVGFCTEKNFAGIECLSGIPGLVGGTPIQNVGAYGQEVSETIVTVRVYDRKTREILELTNQDCAFAYRTSIFNTTQKDRFVVLSVVYALQSNGLPKIVYADLKKHFAGQTPTLPETREAVCRIREEKGMLVRQGGFDGQSAGSFFKNPLVDKSTYTLIERTAQKLKIIGPGEKVPFFDTADELLKIPAAWLIERSGFEKGYQKGKAGLSKRHTLALTNRGGATANEILLLKTEIQEKIKGTFGIELIPEPNLIGFEN